MDRESVEKLSSLIKNNFSKKGKTHRKECNQASYSTKDPNNIKLSKNFSQQKKCQAFRSKTHTHILNKSNQFYISIPCNSQITLYLHIYQK